MLTFICSLFLITEGHMMCQLLKSLHSVSESVLFQVFYCQSVMSRSAFPRVFSFNCNILKLDARIPSYIKTVSSYVLDFPLLLVDLYF